MSPAQSANDGRKFRVAFLLPYEMRIWSMGIMPILGELVTFDQSKPWDISRSPEFELTADKFAKQFGPIAFANALQRYKQSGLIAPVGKSETVFKLARHPNGMVTMRVTIDTRWVSQSTPKPTMDFVTTIRENCDLPDYANHNALTFWLNKVLPSVTSQSALLMYGGFKPTKMFTGPKGLFVQNGGKCYTSVPGLTAVDWLPAADPDTARTTYAVWDPPADANQTVTRIVVSKSQQPSATPPPAPIEEEENDEIEGPNTEEQDDVQDKPKAAAKEMILAPASELGTKSAPESSVLNGIIEPSHGGTITPAMIEDAMVRKGNEVMALTIEIESLETRLAVLRRKHEQTTQALQALGQLKKEMADVQDRARQLLQK